MADINAGDKVKHLDGGNEMTVKSVSDGYAVVSFTARDGTQAEKKFSLKDLQKA